MKTIWFAFTFVAFLLCIMSCKTFVYNSAFINQTWSPPAIVLSKNTETIAKFGATAAAFFGSDNDQVIGGDLGLGVVWGSQFLDSNLSWNFGFNASALLAQVSPKWEPSGIPPIGKEKDSDGSVLFAAGARGQISNVYILKVTDFFSFGLGPHVGFSVERGSYFDKRREYQSYTAVDSEDYFGNKTRFPVLNTSETGMSLTAQLQLQTIMTFRDSTIISVSGGIGWIWPSFPYSPLLSDSDEQYYGSASVSYQTPFVRFWGTMQVATVVDAAVSFKFGTEFFLASTAE